MRRLLPCLMLTAGLTLIAGGSAQAQSDHADTNAVTRDRETGGVDQAQGVTASDSGAGRRYEHANQDGNGRGAAGSRNERQGGRGGNRGAGGGDRGRQHAGRPGGDRHGGGGGGGGGGDHHGAGGGGGGDHHPH